MEKRNTAVWFQALSVCSALGLGGAYVWSRQKQSAPPMKPAVAPAVPIETSEPPAKTDPASVEKSQNARRPVLSGSKSGIIATPPSSDGDEEEEKPKEPRVLMPSSKSMRIAPQPQPNDPPKQRTLLPGSKSINSILQPPQQNNEKKP